MKKGALLIILTFPFFMVGCGKNKKVFCTIDKEFESGYKLEAKVAGKIENDVISDAELQMTMDFKEEKLADSTYKVLMSDKDSNMNIKQNKNIITITEKIEQPENQSRQEFIDAYQAEGYTCK